MIAGLNPSRRATLFFAFFALAGCDDLVKLEEAEPVRTLDVILPEGASEQFLERLQTHAQSNGFTFHLRAHIMPGAGESIVFEMRRADMWVFGRNLAEHVSDQSPPGMIGPTVAYDPHKFRLSLFAGEAVPATQAIDSVVTGLESVVEGVGGQFNVR